MIDRGQKAEAFVMLSWLVASLAIVAAVKNPMARLIVVGCSAAVSMSGTKRAGTFKLFIIVGIFATTMRTVLFALTGHTGTTVLFHIPSLTVGWLGGLQIGGDIYREVVLSGIGEGIGLLAVLACIGAFVARVGTSSITRLLPKAMSEASLVMNIAVAFGPQLVRAARDIVDAETIRSGGKRWRSLASLTVPLIGCAMERSITLAESMDSRGFGRKPAAATRATTASTTTASTTTASTTSAASTTAAARNLSSRLGNIVVATSGIGAVFFATLWLQGIIPNISATAAIASTAAFVISIVQPRGLSKGRLRLDRAQAQSSAVQGDKHRRATRLPIGAWISIGTYLIVASATTALSRGALLGGPSFGFPAPLASLLCLAVATPVLVSVGRGSGGVRR